MKRNHRVTVSDDHSGREVEVGTGAESKREEQNSLRRIREYLHDNYGIYFPDEKLYSLENKINRRLRELPIQFLKEYEARLKQDPDEVPLFLDEVSTNKTAFFREKKHWDYLVNRLIPDWQNRTEPLKAWSVACSTGEEPYTLAMLLEDYLFSGRKQSRRTPTPFCKILASDISRKALQTTQEGHYSEERIRSVEEYNPHYVKNFFRTGGENYEVKQSLKKLVTLRRFNLKNDRYPFTNNFNLILCRNVLIYFNQPMIEHVIQQLTRSLVSGGYLFIGHTESLQGIDHTLEKIQPAIFRKK